MIGAVRRRKLWQDLFAAPGRTLLVVLAIAVGVAAFGMMVTARIVLARDVAAGYAATHPPHAILAITPFDESLLADVASIEGVAAAEGRRMVHAKIRTGPDTWNSLQIQANPHFAGYDINLLLPETDSTVPPPPGTILLDRSLRAIFSPLPGQHVTIRTLDGRDHEIELAGYVNDLEPLPTFFSTIASGAITTDTLADLGEPVSLNRLLLVVSGDAPDRARVERMVSVVIDHIEAGGHHVLSAEIPEPGKPIFQDNLDSVLLMLGSIGGLTLVLSALLVFNAMAAVVAQQIPQIGILKSMGGRRRQIIVLYLSMVAVMGLLALVVAVPLGLAGARWLTLFLGETMMDFDIGRAGAPTTTLALQAAGALLVPLAGALAPVLAASRTTIREAIGDHGAVEAGAGLLGARLLRFEGLAKLTQLSVRNTFRSPGRLVLTLAALSMGGAMFVAVIGVRISLGRAMDEALQDWAFDVEMNLDRPYPASLVESAARTVDGVAATEGQMIGDARRLFDDGRLGGSIFLTGLSPDTEIARPQPVEGDWLDADEPFTIFVNGDVLKANPDITVGEHYTLRIGGDEREWRVVGIGSRGFTPRAYVDIADLQAVTGLAGLANRLVVETTPEASPSAVERALLDRFEESGVTVVISNTTQALREATSAQLDGVIFVMLTLAALVALVGGLGLASTMGINVLERTREIGILRSLGASDGVVQRTIMAEGLVISLISCLFAFLFSLPLGIVLGNKMGETLFYRPLDYTFAGWAALLWIGMVVLISIVASLIPARNAARLTIRAALAYE